MYYYQGGIKVLEPSLAAPLSLLSSVAVADKIPSWNFPVDRRCNDDTSL
jgi:hypothetical protein